MNQKSRTSADDVDRAGDNNGNVLTPIQFPALILGRGLVVVIPSLDVISRCTALGFKKRWYDGLILIDSDARRFNVVRARKLRGLPYELTFRDFLGLLDGNPRWQVELVFAPDPPKISFEQIEAIIQESFKRERNFWESMSDFEEFEGRVAGANSLEQIFAAFKEFNLELNQASIPL